MTLTTTSTPADSGLNICIISKRFPTSSVGGEAGFLWPIARGLVRQGHRVTVLTARTKVNFEPIDRDGVRAHFLNESGSEPFADLALRKFTQLHRQQAFDLVHSLDSSGLQIGLKRNELKVALVYDVDATQMSLVFSILGMSQESLGGLLKTSFKVAYTFIKSYLSFDRKLLKTADAVFVHSPQQRQILERYYMYPDQRIFMVPFGIEVEDLSPRERSQELMKKLGLPLQSQIVVTSSDMSELGEIKNLLVAFERVAVKKSTARLIIVGHGPLRKEIEFEMLRLALGSRVIFVGDVPTSQITDYIALADVFVNLSTRSSGVEQTLLEAMAQKKVIIGSEVSPLATVVEDGVDGFLIRPADTFTLSELFLQIFGGQIQTQQMGDNAREKVLKLFDSQKMLEQTLAAYNKARHRFVTAHRSFFSLVRVSASQ